MDEKKPEAHELSLQDAMDEASKIAEALPAWMDAVDPNRGKPTNNIVDELRRTKLNHGSDRCDPLPDQECGCGDIYIEQRLAGAADLIEQLDREQADIALAYAEQQAETERLKKELDGRQLAYEAARRDEYKEHERAERAEAELKLAHAGTDAFTDALLKLETERDNLRAALREIASINPWEKSAQKIAAAALKEGDA